MKTLCKLTDKNGQTYGETQWGAGVTHTASGEGNLCGPGWIHYYDDPLLAILLNRIHGNFKEFLLWEIQVAGEVLTDRGLKFGATSVTTLREMPIPAVTTEQGVAFGILCALEVYHEPNFSKWATGWLAGSDRGRAKAADAARAAADAAAAAAVWAADAAVWAADAAADAAARAAADAAVWAARARAAADADAEIDLSALAQKALKTV